MASIAQISSILSRINRHKEPELYEFYQSWLLLKKNLGSVAILGKRATVNR